MTNKHPFNPTPTNEKVRITPDDWLDEMLTNLDVYKLNQGGIMGGVDFSVAEHYAMYPELKAAKAAINAKITELLVDARIEAITQAYNAIDDTEQIHFFETPEQLVEHILQAQQKTGK